MDKGLPIRSICRALDIIKIVNRLRTPSLTEIANAAGLPYPTAFRIVQTLVHEGVIEQEPFRKRYRATELVKTLSSGFQEDDLLSANAVKAMHDFTAKYLWPVALVVRVGSLMMVKHSTHQLTSQTLTTYYPGHSVPLLDSASGRVYLAFCNADEREIVTQGLASRSSPKTEMSLQILTEGGLLEQIRQQGYADSIRSQFNHTPGKTSALAVPVLLDGEVVACLSLIFFDRAMPIADAVDNLLAPLQVLARQIIETTPAKQAASKSAHA